MADQHSQHLLAIQFHSPVLIARTVLACLAISPCLAPTSLPAHTLFSPQQGEYGLLFAALSVMPELQVEDMMLEEILTLFKLYDTDGSGELDEEEFVNALAAAGE